MTSIARVEGDPRRRLGGIRADARRLCVLVGALLALVSLGGVATAPPAAAEPSNQDGRVIKRHGTFVFESFETESSCSVYAIVRWPAYRLGFPLEWVLSYYDGLYQQREERMLEPPFDDAGLDGGRLPAPRFLHQIGIASLHGGRGPGESCDPAQGLAYFQGRFAEAKPIVRITTGEAAVAGWVRSRRGAPLRNVRVYAFRQGRSGRLTARTDARGRYSIRVREKKSLGRYVVRARVGRAVFRPSRRTVGLRIGRTARANFTCVERCPRVRRSRKRPARR